MQGWQVDPRKLREKIDALRVERRWSTTQLLEHLGISSSFLYYLLSGERQPDLLNAHRLAERLGCEIEDFMVELESMAPRRQDPRP